MLDQSDQSQPTSVVSRRRARYKARKVTFARFGHGVDTYLNIAETVSADRVLIAGDTLGINELRNWVTSQSAVWLPDPKGHYLQGANTWAARYVHARTGQRVELRPSSEWFGKETNLELLSAAWKMLGTIAKRFNEGALLASPAATGRDWWVRTMPHGLALPALNDEAAELVRSTSGQGRFEVLAGKPTIPNLIELDGRLMYLALMQELPGRLISHQRITEHSAIDYYDRARYRIQVTVPSGWAHVGLVGRMREGRGWEYPCVPGERWHTWVDGTELALLAKHGWPVKIHERLLFERARPLDLFARKMVQCIQAADTVPEHGRLASRALRLMAIAMLGAFQGRGFLVDHQANIWDGPLPAGALNVRTELGVHYYQIREEPKDSSLIHPHFAAAVWARARVRLLESAVTVPGAHKHNQKRVWTGALHMPREHVVGFALDAIYSTHDPLWPDDGKPGRFRSKGITPGPLARPFNVRTMTNG